MGFARTVAVQMGSWILSVSYGTVSPELAASETIHLLFLPLLYLAAFWFCLFGWLILKEKSHSVDQARLELNA